MYTLLTDYASLRDTNSEISYEEREHPESKTKLLAHRSLYIRLH